MPILTDEQKRDQLTKFGYNPDLYDAQETPHGYQIVPKTGNQPSVSAPTTADAIVPTQPTTAAIGTDDGAGNAAARAGIRALPSIAGGVAAAELTGAALDSTGVGALVGVPLQIAAPFVGAWLGNKAADKAKEQVLGTPETSAIQQQSAQDYAQHPWAVRGGNVGAMIAGGGMSPSVGNLVGAAKTLRPSSPLWVGQAAAPEIRNLLNVSVGAAAPTIQGLANGQSAGDIGLDALTGALLSRPNVVGTKLWGMQPQAGPIENAPSLTERYNTLRNPAPTQAELLARRQARQPAANVEQTTAVSDNELVPGYGLPQQRPIEAPNLPKPPYPVPDNPLVSGNDLPQQGLIPAPKLPRPLDVALDAHQQEQARSVEIQTAKLKAANDAQEQQLTKPAATLSDVLPSKQLESPEELRQQLADEQSRTKDQAVDTTGSVDKEGNPSWLKWANRAFDKLGVQHNVKVEPVTGRLVNEHGVELNGRAYLRNGIEQALAKVTSNQPDTYPHEFGHILFDDMAKLGTPSQQKLVSRILRKVSESPEFAEYNAKRVANGQAPHDAEEFLMQHSGNEFIRRMNDPSMDSALNDFWSNVKTRWGNPSVEQLSRFMNNKLVGDRPFSETYGANSPTATVTTGSDKTKNQDGNERVYGHWIAPSGEMHTVYEGRSSHEKMAIDIIKDLVKKGKISTEEFDKLNIPFNSTSDVENMLYNRGYARGVHYGPNDYYSNGGSGKVTNLTPRQEQSLRDYGIENRINVKHKPNEYGWDNSKDLYRSKYQEAEYEKPNFIGRMEGMPEFGIDGIDLYNLKHDLKDASGKVLHPKDSTVSNETLDKYGVKYDKQEQPRTKDQETPIDPKGKLFKPTMSGVDAIRNLGSEDATRLADAATKTLADKEELFGRHWNPVGQATEKLSAKQAANVDKALQESRIAGEPLVGMLSTQAEKHAFNVIQEQLSAIREEQIARNLPITESSGARRVAGRDPNYYANRLDTNAYEVLKANTDRSKIEKMREDFIEANDRFSGMSAKDASEAFDEMASGIRQDASKRSAGSGNDSYFNAVRKAESTILPESMRETDLVKNLKGYMSKAAADLSYGKHVESDPVVNKLLGGNKDPWGKELPPEVQHLQSLAGNKPVSDVFGQIRGEANSLSGDLSHALESATTATMLGPLTEVHKGFSSVAQTIAASHPTEVVQTIVHGLTHLSEGWAHALESGSATVSGRNASDNISTFIDANSTAADRIKALGNLARQTYTLNGMTDKFTKSFLQSSGEYLMASKLARANAGNKTDQMLLKQLDPDYTVGKQYSPEYAQQLGASFSGMVHGTKDARTLPSWMLKDTEINSFFKLASWNIAQTNNFMRNVWTPATKGNFEPFIMSTLGAALGGYVIKELREKIADRKGGIPSLEELVAEGELKKETGHGKSVGENAPLVAYNMMAYSAMAGFGGILSSVAKDVFDLRYKNQPQGSVFPLDEVATSTAKIGSQYLAALMSPDRDASVQDITERALVDYAKSTVQLARITAAAYGNANPSSLEGKKHAYGEALQDQRRFKMVEGVPYEDQSSAGAGSDVNPYLTQGATEFKKESDVTKALEELRPLLNNIVTKYGDNWEVLQSKLEGLKSIGYETMPSLDNTPIEFSRYFSFIRKNKGEAEATRILSDYLRMKAINQLKSSLVP